MRQRAVISVAGPEGVGKTTFIESVLRRVDPPILVARCRRDDGLDEAEESSPGTDPELGRYLAAGADAAARFTFPGAACHDDFFMTDLMADYSRAVMMEGDNPLSGVDLAVFVAPTPNPRERLFVRRSPSPRRKDRVELEQRLQDPAALADFMGQLLGEPLASMLRSRPDLVEAAQAEMMTKLATKGRSTSPPKRRWAVSERYAGIERAQLVIVNVGHPDERNRAERLLADLVKLRQDDELSADVLGHRRSRIPITAVAANLVDPADPGVKKAIDKVRRTVQSRAV